MEKIVLKGKKEIALLVSASINEIIKTVGLLKQGKKLEQLVEKASGKIASKVSKKMKTKRKKGKTKKLNNKKITAAG
jgi:hypothetical protein